MKQFEDTYKPLADNLTIKQSEIDGLGLFASDFISSGYDLGETHVFAVSTNRREWVRTPLKVINPAYFPVFLLKHY